MRYQFEQQEALLRVLGGRSTRGAWKFNAVEPYVTTTNRVDTDYTALCSLLGNGHAVLMKVPELYPDMHRRLIVVTKAVALIVLAFAVLFWTITTVVLGTLAALCVIGVLACVVIRWGRTTIAPDPPVARKSVGQRLAAAAGVGLSFVASRYLRRMNARYLDFGCVSNEAFLTNSKARWPTR